MKIKHFFGLAVLAAMTASCSSNNDLVGGGNGSGENESGASYASITINLPTTSGTRAANDKFDGGTASEYTVNDATLLIFKKAGTSENEFEYVETASLGNLEPWKKDNTDDNGITTEATITAKLEKATVGEKGDYYALVILNKETKTGDDKVTLPSSPTTYGAWNAATNATNLLDNTKGFYMANAPEFTEADKEPTTLVHIKGIYRTKEEAQSKPGTTVHVERGLAKVTVGSNSTGKNYFAAEGANATGTKYSSDKVQITKWALDVTNTKSFPVHVTSGLKAGITPTDPTDQNVPAYADIWKNEPAAATGTAATYRFVSQLSATGAFKRVYWGIDPNYSMGLQDLNKCKEQFTLAEADGQGVTWNEGSDKPLYCLENTFDINNMKQGQTTRVLLKATYTPNALASATDKTFFMIGNSSDIWTTETLKAQIAGKAKDALGMTTDPTVELKGDLLKGGTHFLTTENVSIKDGETEKVNTTDLVDKLNTKLGLDKTNGVGIKTYEKGESYYIARIKHFGDDLTPWKEGDDTYGENNLKWLGRYGVLRNNWYDLTIEKISGPGYPDVPEVKPDTPDDEDTKYIKVSVKILDWAKRSQSVVL